MTYEEETSWLEDLNPMIYIIYSFNFVDFDVKDEPIKRTVTGEKSFPLVGMTTDISIDLEMVFTTFKSSLINPFDDLGGDESEFFVLDAIDID